MAGYALFFENTIQLSENILRFAMGRPEVYGSKSSTLIKNYCVFWALSLMKRPFLWAFLSNLFCAVFLKIGFNRFE